MAKSKYKPISFSTTMRNPERIAYFLTCIQPFEGQILSIEIIYEIIKNVIREKLYRPNGISHSETLKAIYDDEEQVFSEQQLCEIIEDNPQSHKEAGFDYGWPSRFDTWYKLPMEFGFLFYEMNKPIIISSLGHKLINAVTGEVIDNLSIQNIFSNAMSKYQSNNPYRKILNDNVPMLLLLNVIKKMKHDDPNSPGISRQELSFFICWPNNDTEALYNKILSFRNRYSFGEYTDELIYEECLNILGYGDDGRSYIKMDKVTGEAVDEYIRKMRITGLFSLRGNGRFLDWNTLEINRINYIIENYSNYNKYASKQEFFQYMGVIDQTLFITNVEKKTEEEEIRQKALKKYSDEYSVEFVYNEIKNVCYKRESRDDLLRFIPAPVRLEFLTSIALVQNCTGLSVMPNYHVDDEGIPTSPASGGLADIECKDDLFELVEVTLMCGRNQVHQELIPITRHLKEYKEKTKEDNSFAVFLAPSVHADTVVYSEWQADVKGTTIIPLNVDKFIEAMKTHNKLSALISDGDEEDGVQIAADNMPSYHNM